MYTFTDNNRFFLKIFCVLLFQYQVQSLYVVVFSKPRTE